MMQIDIMRKEEITGIVSLKKIAKIDDIFMGVDDASIRLKENIAKIIKFV